MGILALIIFSGGLSMFLFGMTTMSSALEKVSGERLSNILAYMTRSTLRGILFGIGTTAIIQSSSATIIMLIGFVNAGAMTLVQAVPVIMGANIGTTVTAQILRIGVGGTQNIAMEVFKPANLAYIFITAGFLMIALCKKPRNTDIGRVLVGLGILFLGMRTMETAFENLADNEYFKKLLLSLQNPLLAFLFGIATTAVMQSSSAAVGILQAMSATGAITWGFAAPTLMGQNIGACTVSLIGSIGANKNAKSAALVNVYFNSVSSAVFMALFCFSRFTLNSPFWNSSIDKSGIANFHTAFNVIGVLMILPLSKMLTVAAEKTAGRFMQREHKGHKLDKRFYKTPAVAMERCRASVAQMAEKASENFAAASRYTVLCEDIDKNSFSENEAFLDRSEVKIGQFMLGIKQELLPDSLRKSYNEMAYSLREFERIGDYAEYILQEGDEMRKRGVVLKDIQAKALKVVCDAAGEIVALTASVYKSGDLEQAMCVEPLEQVIDILKKRVEDKLIERIQSGGYKVHSGIFIAEILNYCASVADNCSDVAVRLVEAAEKGAGFDRHEYLRDIHKAKLPKYASEYDKYSEKYFGELDNILN